MDETTEEQERQDTGTRRERGEAVDVNAYVQGVLSNPEATQAEKAQAYGYVKDMTDDGVDWDDAIQRLGVDETSSNKLKGYATSYLNENWDTLDDDTKKSLEKSIINARGDYDGDVDAYYADYGMDDDTWGNVFRDYKGNYGDDRSWSASAVDTVSEKASNFWDENVSPVLNDDDLFGKSGEEIADEYQQNILGAKEESDNAWQAEKDLLTAGTKRDDGTDRTIASSLNAYDKTMDELNANTENAVDAQKNYNDYMNPYTQQQIDTANQAIAGASGAKLQSSATQNAIASNTASMQGSAYNNAVSDALTDASNTLSNTNTQSQVAGNLLTADATPEQDIVNMNNDWASENLETAVNSANTIAGTQTADQGLLGTFVKRANTYKTNNS